MRLGAEPGCPSPALALVLEEAEASPFLRSGVMGKCEKSVIRSGHLSEAAESALADTGSPRRCLQKCFKRVSVGSPGVSMSHACIVVFGIVCVHLHFIHSVGLHGRCPCIRSRGLNHISSHAKQQHPHGFGKVFDSANRVA